MHKIMLVLLLSLMIVPCVCAVDDVYEEFMPVNFVFEYNDHNSTTYEGDSGLKVAVVNNEFDNNSYFVPTEYVRGIAYATKGTFKFNEPILFSHGPLREWDGMYVATKFKFRNGTIIPYLGIEKNDLTNEQKKYFDDYNSQRSEYLMQQQEDAVEDLYDYESIRDSHRPRFSYYYGRGGSGVIYTPRNTYW
ncbi:MAG: hypothetical protein E7Z85_06640 [Methanosphaera stadtmanae]|nr:hypothetical protein [Methanosphaera stadtmanae]